MPKKTKKEKLLAQQHRAYVPPVVTQETNKTRTESVLPSTQFTLSLSPKKARLNKTKTELSDEYSIVKRDILKTILLTSIILVSEFLLTKWLPL